MDSNLENGSKTSGANVSYWIASSAAEAVGQTQQMPATPTLGSNIQTEVLIVGGGIAGLTTAYLLLKSGKQVTLIEDGLLASGESGRTTAHLTAALDDRYYYIENVFGEKGAQLAAQSHMSAIGMIEKIVTSERIDCHFRKVNGYLFLHPTDKPSHLEKEFEATKRAGLPTDFLYAIPGIVNGTDKRCIEFSGQAQFHILKYLTGVANAIVNLGGKIYTKTRAEEISSKGAKANGFQISAEHIVVATNTPINDLVTMHTKQHPYRTYVIAAKIKKGALPYALWWDTGNVDSKWVSEPYHYVRLEQFDDSHDILIAGGEDHKTGQAESEQIPEHERYLRLEAWTREHFPEIENVVYHWSGQVMEPVDSLGFMGKNPGDDNVYIITGDSGNGMTHTTIGAMINTDLINGRENRWAKLYDPARITFKTAGDFLSETGNMAAQYLDWVLPSDLKDAESLNPGDGGIMTSGLKKVALYRDDQGQLHSFSAVCPHLGCIVKWNGDEKTFDCPCHGSRFTCNGTVINGPALTDLPKLEG